MLVFQKPKYFNSLTAEDQNNYNQMQLTFSSHACRNNRNKRNESFNEVLSIIKSFCVRGTQTDWQRCMACGIFWINSGVVINTRQLRILISKCKSSINGSFQKLGYTTLEDRSGASKQISNQIPLLRHQCRNLREWTIREYHHVTSQRKEPYLMRFIKLAPINNNIKEETKTNETFFEDKGFFFDSFGDEFSEDLMFRDIW